MNTITIGARQAQIGSTVCLSRNFQTDTRSFNSGHIFKIRNILNEHEVILEDSNGFIVKIHKNNIV